MTRYILTPKLYTKFITLRYNMACKICSCPIIPGDTVESKAGGSQPKLYHAKCYDDSHYSLEYTYEKLIRYEREELEEILVDEFESELPDGISTEELIELILVKELEWITDNLK
jgi:hypothetical protein